MARRLPSIIPSVGAASPRPPLGDISIPINAEDNDGTDHIVTYLDTANIEHNNSWYQEFKLSGDNDLMDWVSGVSFYSEQARQTSQTNTNTDSLDTLAQNVDGEGLPLTEISQGLADVRAAL